MLDRDLATLKDKSYAKSLKLGPELQKYMHENENYRPFIELCDQIIEVNENICDLRGSVAIDDENEAEALKKNYSGTSAGDTERGKRIVNMVYKGPHLQ